MSQQAGTSSGAEASRRWRMNHPERARASWHKSSLKVRYGITPEQRQALASAQQGRCGNPRCDQSPTDVDHSHSTGAVRGLLCNGCNSALGRLNDDHERLIGLLEYLASHQSC